MSYYDNNFFNSLNKSKLTPKPFIFSIVWTILYFLIFVSFIKVKKTELTVSIFIFQFILNLIWPYLFFNKKEIEIAFIDLILLFISVCAMFYIYYKETKISAYLLIPYIAWLCLAGYLNYYIVENN